MARIPTARRTMRPQRSGDGASGSTVRVACSSCPAAASWFVVGAAQTPSKKRAGKSVGSAGAEKRDGAHDGGVRTAQLRVRLLQQRRPDNPLGPAGLAGAKRGAAVSNHIRSAAVFAECHAVGATRFLHSLPQEWGGSPARKPLRHTNGNAHVNPESSAWPVTWHSRRGLLRGSGKMRAGRPAAGQSSPCSCQSPHPAETARVVRRGKQKIHFTVKHFPAAAAAVQNTPLRAAA
ncbi:uncharacterized protein Tco025E_01254 [Trypanosoma conorhini]|uniref:Uncharacterized protein n=1 Tax=Trypanosoma conorhini TaxID=83891 RepID=A0A3R7NZN2_9TRYP|nr:uncharacterized protein Tco025E_01254 [Trypanosoma conorhini]RNF26393.1 hypothetical protein Tco025E_01254 [Trypanosoma conorhini]